MNSAYKIIVSGLVQGVGFRFYTKKKADEFNLIGDVQNQDDGTVKIHVYGPDAQVQNFLDWCHQGPSSSEVETLVYESIDYKPPSTFIILR